MKNEAIRRLAALLLAAALLLLSGCRARTTLTAPMGAGEGRTGAAGGAEDSLAAAEESGPGGSGPEDDDSAAPARENSEARRKEYDENAAAEIVPATDRRLGAPGEGEGRSRAEEEAARASAMLDGKAKERATRTVSAEKAEQKGVSEEAARAESALLYYTVLLEDRQRGLYECKKLSVYWETERDHVTVYKTSPEHETIAQAGAYDVSARLLEENLRVDDGWIARKDPGVVVKALGGGALGAGVHTAARAEAARAALLARPEWDGLDAVRNGRVLLVSGDLLEARWGRAVLALLIAKTANPELYADVDMEEALRMLMEEATGLLPDGIYFTDGGAR